MSSESVAFFHDWMKVFITDAERGRGRERDVVLASLCRDAAARAGLSIDDEPEWGSIASIIYVRMQTPEGDELKFWHVWPP